MKINKNLNGHNNSFNFDDNYSFAKKTHHMNFWPEEIFVFDD